MRDAKVHETQCASHRHEMGGGCDCYLSRHDMPPCYLHTNQQTIVCPWCGELMLPWFDDLPGQGQELTCFDCGRVFRCHVTMTPVFSTERKE